MNWPSVIEREQIERALLGEQVEKLTIIVEERSPWLQVDAWIHLEGERKLALWRATGAVHEIGADGAVTDEEVLPARWQMDTL